MIRPRRSRPVVEFEKETMKTRYAIVLGLAGLVVALICSALAADQAKTITGEGKCAKFDLKEAGPCQTVVQVKDGEKIVTYYLATHKVSTAFHTNVCKTPKQVTATGPVKQVNGKLQMTATKIELVK